MRLTKQKLHLAISATSGMLAFSAHADFSYNFDGLTGSPNPGTPLVGSSTFVGTVGQDNWVNTSGSTSQVRSDPPTGFSGNYLAPTVATPANGFDNISTRVGDNLGLNSRYAIFQFDGLVGPGYVNTGGATVARRSEIMPGVDANMDGDIRGTASSTENNEVAFQFGYEATGAGWFVRRAAYSNTGTVTAPTTANGVYRMQLVVDFQGTPVVISGQNYFDGAGTLYVKQIADASGNPVNDVYRLADPATANVNLGLTTGMGTFGAANPANWNGLTARVANNGGIDNILFKDGLPNTPPTWAADAGNWLSSGNWYLTVPNGIDAEADFTGGARADSSVFADAAVTVGKMIINNTHSYVFGGAGSLTLQTSTGNALVDVQAGSHKINLPLTIASDTTLNVAAGATLKISDPVTINTGKSILQTGTGNVIYESNVNLQSGAALALENTVSIHALSISGATDAWDSKVNVNHTMVVRSGDLSQVKNQIKSGFNGGAWNGNGITSSSAAANSAHPTALGYASAASLLGLSGSANTTFDGQYVDASSLLVKYTWSGDANLDGVVNSADFSALAANFNGSSKAWQTGDFNYDGTVNALDFNLVASNFGQNTPPPGAALRALVPEPTSLWLAAIGAAALTSKRRRK